MEDFNLYSIFKLVSPFVDVINLSGQLWTESTGSTGKILKYTLGLCPDHCHISPVLRVEKWAGFEIIFAKQSLNSLGFEFCGQYQELTICMYMYIVQCSTCTSVYYTTKYKEINFYK